MNTLHISLFGRVQVMYVELDLEVKLTHSLQAVLAFLLIHRARTYPRDVLATQFWGEQPQEKARSSLNTALWRLRTLLEPKGTLSGTYLITNFSGEVGFNPQASYWLDTGVFEEAVQRILVIPFESITEREIEKLKQTLQLYRSELLEGFQDDWALRERERMRMLYLNSLAYLMRLYAHLGRYEIALDYGNKILMMDPIREEIHNEMILLHMANGQRAQAVHQYELCRKILQDELGIEPMEETQALYKRVIANSQPAPIQTSSLNISRMKELLQQIRQEAQSIGVAQAQLMLEIEAMEMLLKITNK